ncbi:MAG: DNA repair and recombination protein RadA [Nitrososphaerales archaeon]
MGGKEMEVDSLEGVGPATRQKLTDVGINTILDLAIRGPSDVADGIGFDMARAIELCNKARLKLVELGRMERDFVPASEILERRRKIGRVTTGTNSLDDLLMGGIESQAVTEFYGEFGSGKTQICHTLCITVQAPPDEGGLDGGAIYVDTENTFRPERIYDIARARDKDADEILSRITVAKAYNSAHQELIMGEVGSVLDKTGARLIIVDSAVAHYRAEFLGRGTLAERQQKLNRFMHLLTRTAETRNVAIVLTNQVLSTPDVFFGDPSKPVGGHVVAHTSTYRISLRKAGKNRIARMVDSPYHPEREAVFVLNEKGVDDGPSDPKKGKQISR